MTSGPEAQLSLKNPYDQDVELAHLDSVPQPEDHTLVVDQAVERRLVRKLDLLIMPAAIALYLFSSLDKGNLGNAKTIGMIGRTAGSLGTDASGSRYALLNGFYFIGYALWLIPTTLFAKRTKVNIVLGCSGIFWGIAAASTAAVTSWGGAEAARFFVGMGESGFGPVIPFYLSRWYTRRELGLRMALFLFSGPLAGVINGLVAYGVSFAKDTITPWRLLFVIEGCPAVVAGFYALLILPGEIETTRRLSEEERRCEIARKAREATVETNNIEWKQVLDCLRSWQILLPAVTYQCVILVGSALGAFLPTLVADQGYSGAIAQLYTLPPYATAAICMLIAAWLSDRYGRRGYGMMVGFASMTLGFAMLLGLGPQYHSGRYAALVFCDVGQFICIPFNLTWVAENSGNESRRAFALPFTIAIAQALAIASGYLFPAKDSPVYRSGAATCMALCALGFLVSLLYMLLLRRANAQKDKDEGGPPGRTAPDTAKFADKAKGFRYTW